MCRANFKTKTTMTLFTFIATYNIEVDSKLIIHVPESLLMQFLQLFDMTKDALELQPMNGKYLFDLKTLLQP